MSADRPNERRAGRLAGLDIGTTSICCTVADAATGASVWTASHPNDSAAATGSEWEREQNPDRIVRIAAKLLAEAAAAAGVPDAIGISCQMHGIVYTDRAGRAVGPLYTWQDRRADWPAAADGVSYADELSRLTGMNVAAGYGMATHYCLSRRGDVPPDAAKLGTIGDYLAMRLTGAAEPVIDPSNAAGLGLFDVRRLRFDAEAMARAGLDAAMLPRIAGRGEAAVVGRTPEGVPVVCAIGDNQASFLGAVRDLARTLLINVGTGSQVSVYSPEPAAAGDLESRPLPGGDGYLLVGASPNGGAGYARLERRLRERPAGSGEAPAGSAYERLNRLAQAMLDAEEAEAAASSGADAAAAATPDRAADEITADVRACLYGLADELLALYRRCPQELRAGVRTAVGSGNGIRRNAAMRRVLERRFGMPVELAAAEEEAALGAALYAGVGIGLYADNAEAVRLPGAAR